jgi:hypothetical protein
MSPFLKCLRHSLPCILLAQVSCLPRGLNTDDTSETADLGPYKRCQWQDTRPLPPFQFPQITISRRGLTTRLVGTWTQAQIDLLGGEKNLLKNYPHVKKVSHYIDHEIISEKSVALELKNPTPFGGWILNSRVISAPPNTFMVVYPTSIAAVTHKNDRRTIAGKFRIQFFLWNYGFDDSLKIANTTALHARMYGGQPVIMYTADGQSLHGPITNNSKMYYKDATNRDSSTWRLMRGEVSKGCNRLQGEHAIELSTLLGCAPDGRNVSGCPLPSRIPEIKVTVMEDFDFSVDPAFMGEWKWSRNVFENPSLSQVPLVALDSEYPRERQHLFKRNLNKASPDSKFVTLNALKSENHQTVDLQVFTFPSWDNLETKRILGHNCKD